MSDINDFIIEDDVLTGYNGDGGDIVIPDGVTEIGAGAFQNCSDITSVVIPDSVTSIGDGAFDGCDGLTDVLYTGSQAQWAEIIIGENNDALTQASIEYDYVLEHLYTITITQPTNGSVTADTDAAAEGDTVTLTITPDAGYELDDLVVTQESSEITVTDNSFTMPAGDVTITATFRVAAPVITVQPADVQTGEALTATFAISAENGDVSYQWKVSIDDGLTWNNVSDGGTDDTYTFTAEKSQDGNQYKCVATNETGSTDSNSATLTVLSDPSISTQPDDTVTVNGGSISFAIAATGDELTYQWQTRTEGEDWSNYSGSGYNTDTITLNNVTVAMDQREYRCIVSNPFADAISDEVALTVISFTEQPVNVKTGEGLTAAFSIDVNYDLGIYQWQVSNDNGSTWSNVPNASLKGLSFTSAKTQDRNQYRCSVTRDQNTMYSNTAVLTVLAKPQITVNPSDVGINAGENAEFSVTATGDELSYQWQVLDTENEEWTNCTGNGYNTSKVTISNATVSMDTLQYRCVVSNPFHSATSAAAVLYVIEIITQPANVKTVEGFIAQFFVEVNGTVNYYNWQYKSKNNTTWRDLGTGVTDSPAYIFRANTAYDGYQYRCVIKHGPTDAYTDAAELSVVVPFYLTDGRLVLPEGTYTFALNADQSGVLYALGFDRDET